MMIKMKNYYTVDLLSEANSSTDEMVLMHSSGGSTSNSSTPSPMMMSDGQDSPLSTGGQDLIPVNQKFAEMTFLQDNRNAVISQLPLGMGSTSINDHYREAKRKGSGIAGKSIEEELCLICGDRASGYHYNALSCEGCKGFFRRSITRGATYQCKYGGNCEMDMWMRRKCQACRLWRCREVGMKEECLLSDEQCKARDARRKARMDLKRKQPPEDRQADSPDSQTEKVKLEGLSPVSQNPMDQISADERELVEKIVLYQEEYELPKEDDIQKLTELKFNTANKPKELSETIFTQMAEITVLVTQLIVEFAKRLPGFLSIQKEDQIVLLKGSACEVMMLRTARRYDLETDTIVFANGMPYTKDNLRFAGLKDYVEGMFGFCQGMGKLRVDNAEYALLTAICIFSDRPGLINGHQVEAIQEIYVRALQSYDAIRRSQRKQFFAKLLMKLVELRTLSAEHADVMFSLKVEKGPLPPLLMEYFDVE